MSHQNRDANESQNGSQNSHLRQNRIEKESQTPYLSQNLN
jgi:hypothetical protein